MSAVAGTILGIGQIGLSLYGRYLNVKEKQAAIRLRESYNLSLYELNENAIKASYARNVRANMLSESITLGRIASGLSKANIGTAGTAVPAFQAVMAKTDFDNQGYELSLMTQLGRVATSKEASRTAYEQNISGWDAADWVGAAGDVVQGVERIAKEFK